MIQLTPRSYVFNGLEIIRDTLIPFIAKILRKHDTNSWWYNYIYKKLHEDNEHITRSGNMNDLYVQVDELICFKIIEKNKSLFKDKIDINLVKRLHDIRHNCAHVFLEGGTIDKAFADNALTSMADLIGNINKKNKELILDLKKQMDFQKFDNKPVKASREVLISFLYDKIWKPSFRLLDKVDTIDIKEKKQIINGMEKARNDLEKNKTNTDVLNWFIHHIYSVEGIKTYTKLKNIKGVNIPTFEDIRLEFIKLCYNEQDDKDNVI